MVQVCMHTGVNRADHHTRWVGYEEPHREMNQKMLEAVVYIRMSTVSSSLWV